MDIKQADQDIPLDHSSFCEITMTRREMISLQLILKDAKMYILFFGEEEKLINEILGVITS